MTRDLWLTGPVHAPSGQSSDKIICLPWMHRSGGWLTRSGFAKAINLAFEPLSAEFSGVADLRKVFALAQRRREIG